MRHALLFLIAALFLSTAAATAQPFQSLGRATPQSRFFYERQLGNTSQDVGILRERSMRWLQRELGTGIFDSTTILSPDTIRSTAFVRLPNGDGLRNIVASYRVRVLPSSAGIFYRADNFVFRAYDAVNGEFYDIPFEEADDFFEGNSLALTRRHFDARFAEMIQKFDRLGAGPAPGAEGTPDGQPAATPN